MWNMNDNQLGKVHFNEDLVKADAKEALRAMFSGANLS